MYLKLKHDDLVSNYNTIITLIFNMVFIVSQFLPPQVHGKQPVLP